MHTHVLTAIPSTVPLLLIEIRSTAVPPSIPDGRMFFFVERRLLRTELPLALLCLWHGSCDGRTERGL